MTFKLKLVKIGDSVGLILHQEALALLKAGEGDAVLLTETSEGGFQLKPGVGERVAAQLEAAESIVQRHRNTLSKLAK